MEKYSPDDTMTMYFVVAELHGDKRIKAWSDKKDYCKAFMEFHRCKSYRLTERTDRFDNICHIIEENVFDEINLYNVTTRGKDGQRHLVILPLTGTEHNFINEESLDWLNSRIDYTMLYAAVDFLKKKYRMALEVIHLDDVMNKVLSHQKNKFTENTILDEVLVLYRSFPDEFGI